VNIRETIATLGDDGFFKTWMPRGQRMALREDLKGEEKSFFIKLLTDLRQRIELMPKTYETDGMGSDAIVQLHYFGGLVDAWIIEKDVGNGPDDTRQIQAFGKITLIGDEEDGELGYISIEELIENGIELDLYWMPIMLKEI
jgi:hypothetical protein